MASDTNTLPNVACDVVQDPEGFSAELSVECVLEADQVMAFSVAARAMAPVVDRDGQREIRGLVSLDEQSLWVYVHAVGPGRYDSVVEGASRQLLSRLWDDVHRLARAS